MRASDEETKTIEPVPGWMAGTGSRRKKEVFCLVTRQSARRMISEATRLNAAIN